jgi:hypothetical protein
VRHEVIDPRCHAARPVRATSRNFSAAAKSRWLATSMTSLPVDLPVGDRGVT